MKQRHRRTGPLLAAAAVALALALALAVALARWLPSNWALYALPALLAALLVGLALVLACEFALLKVMAAVQHHAAPALAALCAAWGQELWATTRLMIWRVPVQTHRFPDVAPVGATATRGLILVHGYGCNRGVWAAWLQRLQELQIPCVAVQLKPLFASIDDYGHLVEAAVEGLQRRTGQAPVIVAHSMGGMAARAWWAQDGTASRLHRLITIGSPHQGTLLARFGWGANASQMRLDSAWLARLQASETQAQADRTICYYSDGDNMIIPSASATLPGADNRKIPAMGHVAMVDHPVIFAAALDSVRLSE
jgi:pimeloyl-ACP methyl ester carboxylesterase